MSRKNIWFLALFSAIALTALIVVQLVWIRDAVEVQEKQFDQLISQTMTKIINQLEEYETIRFLEEELVNDGFSSNSGIPGPLVNEETGVRRKSYGLGIEDDSMFILDNDYLYSSRLQMDRLAGDAMVFLPDTSQYDLEGSLSHTRSIISQSDLIDNYDQLYSNRRVYVERVFNKMVKYDQSIEQRLPKLMLDTVVYDQVKQLQLGLNYEYGVKTEAPAYTLMSPGFNPSTEEKTYTSWLYPEDMIKTPNFLILYFPGQKNYIFRSVSFLAATSLFLTLILLIVSFIAIYVIVKQKKLSEIKNDFVSNMTHELKTPISTISLASQMLSDPKIKTDTKNLTHISHLISEESKRLGLQVEKVLQMSIFDQGKMSLKIQTIDPDQLIRQVIDKLELQLKQREANVVLNLDAGGISLQGDNLHLTNVIFNLMDNALKYSMHKPEIEIYSKAVKRGVKIRIIDNGIGMSKDEHRRAFEKFYRVPTGNLHNVKGFGLGLSYVKKVVDEHEGRITIYSELNKGSEFQVFLPFKLEKH
ncbi:MAG: HAMP domain-containing histidine kinase [Bacteroidetes bacterium]|jgi:two-component system, OmpR family, phosphate regulon sensor histidine kinase PhoR|nr:HAMP domain-containing histidine kinase [Bacteroidota bacterium]MBT3748422.1 HAMP domain-containing histidine kinase [Bacteroidota bacterium]MBT4398745.1 HAMP domain-containing histidine kinase [Bacteroidota bacterium]MBT4411692.1 HAMP domain-containing histidine kinase [Bacteroidota bacterium]MBT7094563.1 HAMP domain-containing histidine kinase [Bacteroidota bacterium]